MLIYIENQQKLDELWDLLGELPVNMHHRFKYGSFPMVAELWLDESYEKNGGLFLSDNSLTWEPVEEWEKKLEAELHAKFGNPMDMKGESSNVSQCDNVP